MHTSKKIFTLLNDEQRREAGILLVLMIIGMILETLSVGLVIPVVAFMSTPDLVQNYPAVHNFVASIGLPIGSSTLIVTGIFILVLIYVVKAAFLTFLAWQQGRFTFGLQASLSVRLLEGYLHQPYIFHLQRNSAELVRNVTYETNMLIHSFVTPVLTIISEALVLAGIITVLLVIEPVGATFIVATFAAAGFCFYKIMRSRVMNWGRARQYHDGLRLQYLQEGLNGVKDVKFYGKECEFLKRFALHNGISIQMDKNQTVLQQMPRMILELLAISALAVLVLIMLAQGKSAEHIIPSLGLFLAAAFRLMPSANRIFNTVQSLRYALPVLNNLSSEVRHLDESDSEAKGGLPLNFNSHIEICAVSYTFPGTQDEVLKDISVTIPRGASVGFIGGSGAGKSTLINIILGLLSPAHGNVKVDGQDIHSNLRGWKNLIGYVPQSIFLTDDTIRRNIAFGVPEEQINEDAIARVICAAQLKTFIGTLPEGVNTFVGERGTRLSGGQLQRIGIARALYHDPQVLILDEATSALDTMTETEVMGSIRALRGDKTILVVAHRLSTVVDCDWLYRLENGIVVQTEETKTVLNLPVN